MKKIYYMFVLPLCMGIVLSIVGSCKNDDDPSPLTLVSAVTDGGVDLISSTATSIPVNAVVILTFDKDIDTGSATAYSTSIKANDVNLVGDIVVEGAIVTLKTTQPLNMGTSYTVSITPELIAMDGAPADPTEFSFASFGHLDATPPQSDQQLSYFPFSGVMKDVKGIHSPLTQDVRNLTYAKDRFGFDGSAGEFNGSTSIVEIPSADQYMANRSITMSVWIKASSTKDGQFIMGLAAWKGFHTELSADWSTLRVVTQFAESGGKSDSDDITFSGNGLTNQNGGWQGCIVNKEILPVGGVGATYFKDKWVHIVYTYDRTSQLNTLYLNGEKVVENDYGLWPTTDLKYTISGVTFAGNMTGGGNKLALGFIQGSQNRIITDGWADPEDIFSNHFKGLMDDLRIFKVALTTAEVTTLYNSEKP